MTSDLLDLLPPAVRDIVKDLPEDEAAQVIQKLLVQNQIEFRPLSESDLRNIKARTASDSEFGFKAVDVDLTWQELNRPNYVSLGAFAEHEGKEVPVAFVVAEICKQPKGAAQETVTDTAPARATIAVPAGAACAQEAEKGPGHSSGTTERSSRGPAVRVDGAAPLRASPRELAAAMRAAGCGPRDLAMAIWYIGVSYEYRRQGLGSQLLDLVREVAQQAGCKSVLLHVADYNPNAIAFYTRCGFTAVPEVFKPGERGKHVLMHQAVTGSVDADDVAAAAAAAASEHSILPGQDPVRVSGRKRVRRKGAREASGGRCRYPRMLAGAGAPGRGWLSTWEPRGQHRVRCTAVMGGQRSGGAAGALAGPRVAGIVRSGIRAGGISRAAGRGAPAARVKVAAASAVICI